MAHALPSLSTRPTIPRRGGRFESKAIRGIRRFRSIVYVVLFPIMIKRKANDKFYVHPSNNSGEMANLIKVYTDLSTKWVVT